MALFICPNCEQHTEIKETADGELPFACPHCGREFTIDQDINMILEEDN